MDVLRKIWNFKLLGTALFFIGYFGFSLSISDVEGEGSSFLAPFTLLFLFMMPIGMGLGLFRIIFNMQNRKYVPAPTPAFDADGVPSLPQPYAAATQSSDPTGAGNASVKAGLIMLVLGLVIAVSPVLMAVVSTAPGHNMWSESDSQSGGSALWLLLMTIPLGGILGLVGLVMLIVGALRPPKPQ